MIVDMYIFSSTMIADIAFYDSAFDRYDRSLSIYDSALSIFYGGYVLNLAHAPVCITFITICLCRICRILYSLCINLIRYIN